MSQIPIDLTLSALLVLIFNGVALWIREFKKHKTWRDNGSHLKDIKQKVDSLITTATTNTANIANLADSVTKIHNLGEKRFEVIRNIDTQVGAQAARCKEITDNFRGQLRNHGKKIDGLASRRRK